MKHLARVAIAVIFASTAADATADSTSTKKRAITTLAPGVYMIRHEDAPDEFPQGNTLVVIGARAVLVVDSCYLPSSARADIAQIRQWTKLPVSYLVNTHWHYDHTMGNAAYVDAFPAIAIVAHAETQKQIRGYNPHWFATFADRAAQFRKMITDGKDQAGNPLSKTDVAELDKAATGVAAVLAEFRGLAVRTDTSPTLAFDHELDLDLGDRDVHVIHLGRGNTLGDAVVYLPHERIVATGDLVDHPVPYLGGGYPVEEIATLDGLARLDIATLVPGHGDAQHGTAYLAQEIALLRTVVGAVDQAVHDLGANGGAKLAEVRAAVLKRVDKAALRKQFAGTDKDDGEFFDGIAFDKLIEAAYAETWPR